ncbi:MAG: thioredoxin family protein [Acidimicrobiia bacterium]|nr:thioredoxin family protein [Acidimicrobiia bacterium]
MAVPSTMVPLGTPAPPFELTDPAGTVVRSEDLRSAPALVVMFICNHCPYVKHLRPTLASVTSALIDRGVAVVGINSNDAEAYPDDSPEAMAAEIAEFGYRFPYLVDADQSVAAAYRAACTPDFFVFDGEQRLAYRGQFDDARPSNDVAPTGADLLAAVEAVVAGEAPPAEQRPSLGCSIKWKPGSEPDGS